MAANPKEAITMKILTPDELQQLADQYAAFPRKKYDADFCVQIGRKTL